MDSSPDLSCKCGAGLLTQAGESLDILSPVAVEKCCHWTLNVSLSQLVVRFPLDLFLHFPANQTDLLYPKN